MKRNTQISNSKQNDADAREIREVSDWMQKFAAQTSKPPNLPAPGLLLFKSRITEKQSAARRAVQPIVWMQIASVVMFISAVVWLDVKSEIPIFSVLAETFGLLASVAAPFIFGLIGAALICAAFAYKMRETKH